MEIVAVGAALVVVGLLGLWWGRSRADRRRREERFTQRVAGSLFSIPVMTNPNIDRLSALVTPAGIWMHPDTMEELLDHPDLVEGVRRELDRFRVLGIR